MSPQGPAAATAPVTTDTAPFGPQRPVQRADDTLEAHSRPSAPTVEATEPPGGSAGHPDPPEPSEEPVAPLLGYVRSVRLDADLHARLRGLAALRGRAASDLIRWAVAALVDSAGQAPTELAAAITRLNREAADARLKQQRARRHGDDLAAARAGIRADTLEEAARLVAGQPEPSTPARPVEDVDTGGLL